ncbi:sulfur carrier protein [Arthrobacter ginsengisoli]|uniref:Sulfur carrier protein n=1 Tax=Arthrobacter ginsengisoli TaxID=1356565 RepID=A0ABU1UIC2_9MICC|nr:sulfur carrier protein ThiS [Arthrobacter ginsengisoli]MDR7084946.1 sulfur carrier protein [Arthrobacter ginsengisoli]
MNITLNGNPLAVGAKASVTSLVSQVTGRELASDGHAADGRRLGVAIARNSEVVPRSQWHSTALAEGDAIELVTAIQGG